jgi:hypothetical protein
LQYFREPPITPFVDHVLWSPGNGLLQELESESKVWAISDAMHEEL